MLATPATDSTQSSGSTAKSAVSSMAAPPLPVPASPAPAFADASLLDAGLEKYLTSPEFKDSPLFKEAHSFISSTPSTTLHDSFDEPLITEPWNMDGFLTSPLDAGLGDEFPSPEDTPYHAFLTTPVIADSNDFSAILDFEHDNEPLFPYDSSPVVPIEKSFEASAASVNFLLPPTSSVDQYDLDGLLTISPSTPMLDSMDVSMYAGGATKAPTTTSPSATTTTTAVQQRETAAARRRSTATGTRKGLTPDALVPLDAPTQPRKYALPSATSRKEVPAVFARKRARSVAFANEEEELDELEEGPGVNATEKEQIEWKRRQNTLAARKSRKRKLEHQKELEEQNEVFKRERDEWKYRAGALAELLRSHGIPFQGWED